MISLLLAFAISVDESLFNKLSIYQVMVVSFQDGDPNLGYGVGYGPSSHYGDLQGILNSLEYIKDLGFNAIWMTPIFDSANGQGGPLLQSTGYFCTNYFKVDPKFGSEELLHKLVTKAHSLGIYVILDGVLGHHGGVTEPSPSGNMPQGGTNPVSYPESLPYYKEVVQYWINNFEIDGWRLDQSYQMFQRNHNYLKEIREAVYEACDNRRAQGKEWGILGYIVAEDWEATGDINYHAFGGDGVRSAFDFPARFSMVQAIAQEESGASSTSIENFASVHRTPAEKGYSPSTVYPNLFFTNHDLWRLGNLIRDKYSEDKNSDRYWNRHKMCIAALAVYTGPITLYYGDEIGDITDCWSGKGSSCGPNTASDNCARTDGQITNFNDRQKDLHDFTQKVMKARLEHPSMHRGTYGKTFQGNTYFNCKYDEKTGDKVVYVTTFNWDPTTVSYMVGGYQLVDLVSGEIISGAGGVYSISLEGLGTRIFQVVEGLNNNVTNHSSSSKTLENKKNNKTLLIVACAGAGLAALIITILTVYIVVSKKKQNLNDIKEPLMFEHDQDYTN